MKGVIANGVIFRHHVVVPGKIWSHSEFTEINADLEQWCASNCSGEYHLSARDDDNLDRPITVIALFAEKDDAALFKLFWA